MKNLIVSDVFGRTTALEDIASSLFSPTDILDPYDSKNMGFNSEEQAYSCFMSEIGMDEYAKKLLHILEASPEPINLIGFSVGASAIWKISALTLKLNVSTATCFYGSQIRHMMDVYPQFPIQLIFPKKEQHFSVAELIQALSGRENVIMHKTNFLHGFMNQHSKNYDAAAYHQFMPLLYRYPFSKGSI